MMSTEHDEHQWASMLSTEHDEHQWASIMSTSGLQIATDSYGRVRDYWGPLGRSKP